ncbi:ring finger protein [Stagonosporopsis vannaccii]|nr:ring finger protein [Stagonosporopsis vannaccii]
MSDERAAELETLAAIYSDSLIASSNYSCHIDISEDLQKPVQLPCTTTFQDYPSPNAPTVEVKASWLPAEAPRELEAEATLLWETYGHTQVIYGYISHMEEAAQFAFEVKQLEVDSDVLQQLLDYDRNVKQQAFE